MSIQQPNSTQLRGFPASQLHWPRVFSALPVGRLALLAAFSMVVYLVASAMTFRIGFPLDDAWIHQTYARNLGLYGEWAFIQGIPSAGSTAPLWSILLAAGHFLHLGPYLITFLLGWICQTGVAVVGAATLRRWLPEKSAWATAAGMILVLDWRLAWSAGSGMETLFFSLLILGVFFLLSDGGYHGFWIGLLIGLSVWIRPDGLTLLGPAGLIWITARISRGKRFQEIGKFAGGFALFFGAYLLFNWLIGGTWWPNTFYAKQAEYAVLREQPLFERLINLFSQPLIGAGILLLPGFFTGTLRAIKERSWILLAAAAWCLGFIGLYAVRLPVTYQHARYLIPVQPVFYLLGLYGTAHWLKTKTGRPVERILGRTWQISTLLVLLIFWIRGAGAYAKDVAVIESEMVATAGWINDNTSKDDLVAAHDIGALGYFTQRRLLDLAGLVSPEVIPFIRDEERLGDFITSEGADHLVTFPDWYPRLVQEGDRIYETKGEFSPALGGTNMAVYKWR